MTTRPMEGVRVVEVAQYTFTPASGAVLADWGADVIKIEHAVAGDAQRGLVMEITRGSTPTGVGAAGTAIGSFAPIMEHPNRGKRSIGLDLSQPTGLTVLRDLVAHADVFVTNFLPEARTRLQIDVPHLRKVNPSVIYVRGSAFGPKGALAQKGGFDQSAFWSRGGSAAGVTPPDAGRVLPMPAPAYGDSIGAMTIAGGISAALFARERTGDPSVVDVSLLAVGAWASALAVDISFLTGEPWPVTPLSASAGPRNPLGGNFRTADGRWLTLTMLQPQRYWRDFFQHLGRDDLIDDERFDSFEKIIDNAEYLAEMVQQEFASRTLAEWTERFETMEGQWAPIQDSLDLGRDPQLRANGHVATVVDADGVERELVTNPVLFDEESGDTRRAPQFAEHTDEILRELGRTDDEIMALKLAGAVT